MRPKVRDTKTTLQRRDRSATEGQRKIGFTGQVNGHVSAETLADYAANDLTERASIGVATHIQRCDHCTAELERVSKLVNFWKSDYGQRRLTRLRAQILESSRALSRTATVTCPKEPAERKSKAGVFTRLFMYAAVVAACGYLVTAAVKEEWPSGRNLATGLLTDDGIRRVDAAPHGLLSPRAIG